MKNMKIKAKLILSFMVVVLLAVIIGVVGVVSVLQLSAADSLLNARANMGVQSARLGRILQEQRAAYRGAALFFAANPDDPKVAEELAALKTLAQDWDTLESALDHELQTEEGRKMFDNITKAYSEYETRRDELAAVIADPEQTNEKAVALMDAIVPYANAAKTDVTALADFITSLTDEQDVANTKLANTVTIILIVVLIFALIIAIILSMYIAGIIANPINLMMSFLKQAGETGNLTFTDDEWRKARAAMVFKDEVAQSLAAFVKMLEQFVNYGEALQTVSARDLTVTVKTLGASDTIGTALTAMLDNLNSSFGEVSTSASQVSSGSSQVAQASQNLATGASEQAATIQEFTATVTEIQNMADENTKTATETLADVRESGRVMGECSAEMNNMLTAMHDIDEKSQSISKVIKVIDDIAFQTNILALNAAVEAARAGVHGKGFAVVADEVRNLASKSADAAKETAALIESSSQSVADGNNIVSKVNDRLQAVSTISEKNAVSIEKLHSASRAQSESMAEVTAAITQLSSVVQSNSATAEQTAASSQEMSAQSAVLNQVVSRFKLNANAGTERYANRGGETYRPEAAYSDNSGFALSPGNDKY
ncbi:hypothetical protein FACS1894191_1120 [Clostridia bacterium]|nr:hypothetical protein FACS1894191_1120 [Clostridia bacterium]